MARPPQTANPGLRDRIPLGFEAKNDSQLTMSGGEVEGAVFWTSGVFELFWV